MLPEPCDPQVTLSILRMPIPRDVQLLGLGSATLSTEESYVANVCHTYRGRAHAVVRRINGGRGEFSVESDGLDRISIVI